MSSVACANHERNSCATEQNPCANELDREAKDIEVLFMHGTLLLALILVSVHLYHLIVQSPLQQHNPTYETGAPALSNFKRARTETWNSSFTISGRRLAKQLSILYLEPQRIS